MKGVVCFVIAVLFGETLSQIHVGPIGDPAAPVDCYTCDDHHNGVPGCLNKVHTCHRDQTCSIEYGDSVRIHCVPAHECKDDVQNFMRNCTGGGVEVSHGHCRKCCDTTDCVSDLADLIKIEAATSPKLMCPGHCRENNLQDCMDSARQCQQGQFCQVTKDEHGVKGECKDDHELHHCNDEMRHKDCASDTDEHGHPRPDHGPGAKCYWDCCTTNACLNNHFASVMPTTPATTPAVTTTKPSGSLWDRLNNGQCKDQLAGTGCTDLMKTQDVCHDRLALDICPDTCGICEALNGNVCEDTVLNNGCADLQQTSDVCSDKLAVFICPKTCNMCDELVNSIITSVIDGTSNATDVPPNLLQPSANPSDFPTFDCNDLTDLTCSQMDSLCSTSFVKVVCPDQCNLCMKPIVTAPITTMAPVVTTGAPAVMTSVAMATATPAPTDAPTDAPTTADGAAVGQCADHLNGMPCSDLADVCTSVLALSVCPKYCGLC